jgi:hypothetical protein
MMNHRYTYQSALAAADAIHWRIEDVIGGDKRLDFSKPFMPESLAQVQSLSFLDRDEKRLLNQIRGNTYLTIFGLVEEFILPFVLDQARPELHSDNDRARALLQFASDEAKHIQMFKQFREEFAAGFGTECPVIGPPETIADAILAHDPLGIALTTLHIEWMVQTHYVGSVKDNEDLDPQFKSLLRHHWLDEVQHARLDTVMVDGIVEGLSEDQILNGVEEYLAIAGFIDNGLGQQVEYDMASLMTAAGRYFTESQKQEFRHAQRQANRWTYLGSGMTHPKVLETVGSLHPKARKRVETVSIAYC